MIFAHSVSINYHALGWLPRNTHQGCRPRIQKAMDGSTLQDPAKIASVGHRMHALMSELYPICRSITGPGLRRTLARLAQEVPLDLHEVASGTPAFDWTVPDEWVPVA